MVFRRTLGRMKPGGYEINTARGGLIVEEDLAGAALDVFEKEPLRGVEGILLSPHAAGVDTQSLVDMPLDAALSIVELYRTDWRWKGGS